MTLIEVIHLIFNDQMNQLHLRATGGCNLRSIKSLHLFYDNSYSKS